MNMLFYKNIIYKSDSLLLFLMKDPFFWRELAEQLSIKADQFNFSMQSMAERVAEYAANVNL